MLLLTWIVFILLGLSVMGQEKTVQLFPLDILEDFFNMLSIGAKNSD